MSTINKLKLGDNTTPYNIEDEDARASIESINKQLSTINSTLSSIKSSLNNVQDSYAREKISEFLGNAYAHNAIPRGKSIQTYFDNGSLYTKISSGTFDDLFIGDYWTARSIHGTITFRIAGFDTYLNNGQTMLTKHHAVVVPDQALGSACMNGGNDTSGGYYTSNMRRETIGKVVTAASDTVNGVLYRIFGTHLLTTNELISKSIDATSPSAAVRDM